jgi:hypothetical protein
MDVVDESMTDRVCHRRMKGRRWVPENAVAMDVKGGLFVQTGRREE